MFKYKWSGDEYSCWDDLVKDMMAAVAAKVKDSGQGQAADKNSWGWMFTGNGIVTGKGFNGKDYSGTRFSLNLGSVADKNGNAGFGLNFRVNW